jgi:hypothetical protein
MFLGWFKRKKGRWSDLDKEERLKAKALMYGAHTNAKADADGVVRVHRETISEEKDESRD